MSKHRAESAGVEYDLSYEAASRRVNDFLRYKGHDGLVHPGDVQYWDVVDLVDDILNEVAESAGREQERTNILVDEIAGLKRLRNLALDEVTKGKNREAYLESRIEAQNERIAELRRQLNDEEKLVKDLLYG